MQFWMWKSVYVGVYQLLNWKMHDETLKFTVYVFQTLWRSFIDINGSFK